MIEKIRIQNFKSMGDVTVDLTPVTVLIGPSGVGKSNFLEAIRFFRNYLLVGDQAVEMEGGWPSIWPNGQPQPLAISIQFRLPDFGHIFSYSLCWDRDKNLQVPPERQIFLASESLHVDEVAILSRQGSQWVNWPGALAPPEIRRPIPVYLGQLPTVTEAVLTFSAFTNGVGWHDFPASVFTQSTRPSQPLFGNAKVELNGLSDNADNYLSVLRELTQDLRNQRARRQILARLKQINPTVRSVELNSIQKSTEVVVGHELGNHVIALNLSQESDGFRRYYAHLLSLYQIPPKQLLMFEEPENGIFPGALRNLAEEFNAAANDHRGQILLTTHSPMLLDGFQPEQIRVVELDPQALRTQIGFLDPDQIESIKERLLNPGELLTVDAARIASDQPAEAMAQ
jgi:predicted ATPase